MLKRFRNLKIRYKIALLLGTFTVSIILIVAFILTQQFKSALKERIFLQLTSIRTLKSLQVERLLESHIDEIETLLKNLDNAAYLNALADDKFIHIDSIIIGEVFDAPVDYHRDSIIIQDLSASQNDMLIHLAYYVPYEDAAYVFYLTPGRLQDILFERTGMGNSGETYIVGHDKTMRTPSRFFVDSIPSQIPVNTLAVKNAIAKQEGTLLCNDYRNISVLSSHATFNYHGLSWIILSEMDESEAMLPVKKMTKRAYLVTFFIMILVFAISFLVANYIVKPLLDVKAVITRIAKGERTTLIHVKRKDEIGDLFGTINGFMSAIESIIHFANEISNGKFGADMPVRSEQDELVNALNNMKNQLIQLKENERLLLLKNQRQLVAGEEQERARLSRELHDSIGPLLTNIKLSVQQKPSNDADDLKQQIVHIIEEVRKISFNLMPAVLRDFGLIEAVRNYLKIQFKQTSIQVDFRESKEVDQAIHHELALNIYRIIQEATHNIIKYANATLVRLSITQFENQIAIFISDNGNGFNPVTVEKGNGLINMKERVKMFNGLWDIHSNENGTSIEVEFPINN